MTDDRRKLPPLPGSTRLSDPEPRRAPRPSTGTDPMIPVAQRVTVHQPTDHVEIPESRPSIRAAGLARPHSSPEFQPYEPRTSPRGSDPSLRAGADVRLLWEAVRRLNDGQAELANVNKAIRVHLQNVTEENQLQTAALIDVKATTDGLAQALRVEPQRESTRPPGDDKDAKDTKESKPPKTAIDDIKHDALRAKAYGAALIVFAILQAAWSVFGHAIRQAFGGH